MSRVAISGYSYCLNHTPELGLHYGNTPYMERRARGETDYLANLAGQLQSYEQARGYAPNQAYIGAMDLEELERRATPWHENRIDDAPRYGRYGEIMPEDEFLGLLDICDVFDLVWLEKAFAADVRARLEAHELVTDAMVGRLEAGRERGEITKEVEQHGGELLYCGGQVVGCCRKGHETDPSLDAHVLLENLAAKAGGVLALLHVVRNAGITPDEVDFIVECSEEAAGDMNQRGGGNFAKAIAEIAGCGNASGCDVRGFCAGPVNAMIAGASQVAAGARKNCVVLAGGAIPKLYMNSRDHVKKGLPPLEDCLGNLAVLLTPPDGTSPEMRLDAIGKHTVNAGASPQAVMGALVWEPLQEAGLSFTDVDRYAAELQIAEITLPAGAGDVPTANAKMIGALSVMKKQLEKKEIPTFVKERGVPGFAHTQGHIPSGVPFVGPAAEMIADGRMQRAMIIGKGSLFLARLTNLSDGASFMIEGPSAGSGAGGVTKEEVRELLLESLEELAANLRQKES
ncbi:MAG: DUF5940 domain-containing protein [Synergistales bacterium]|nr:DUF5940 domain-containing protein [Synergistales bacterium]